MAHCAAESARMGGMIAIRFAAVLAAVLAAACSNPAGTCQVSISPDPGLYAATITVAVSVQDASGNELPARIAQTSLSLADAPDAIAAQPETITEPALSQPNPGPILFGEGYHLIAVENPCNGTWTRYAYLVDQSAPLVSFTTLPGLYREPITVAIVSNDEDATILRRVFLADSEPPNFTAATAPIELTSSGTWRVEAFARDAAGNRSATASAEYALFLSEAAIVRATIATPVANAGRLPRIDLEFDRDMETTQLQLLGAITSPMDAFEPIAINLFWLGPRTLAAFPAQRLPRGAQAQIDLTGVRTTAGGGLLPTSQPQAATTISVCLETCPEEPIFALALEQDTIAANSVTLTITADSSPQQWPFLYVAYGTVATGELMLEGVDANLQIHQSGNIRTVTFPTDLVPTAQNASVHVFMNDRYFGDLGAARPATGGDPIPTLNPTVLASVPASGTAVFTAIDIAATVPLDTRSIREHAVLSVNGDEVDFSAVHLPAPFQAAIRITPKTPWLPGDTVSLTLPTTVTDLWGRSLAAAFTTPTLTVAAPSAAALNPEWSIVDGASIRLNTTSDYATVLLSPPPSAIGKAVLIDAATGLELDMLTTVAVTPETRAGVAHAATLVQIQREPWAPELPTGRDYILRLSGVRGANGAALLPIERSIRAEDDTEDPRLDPDIPVGAGFIVTRNDGHLLGPIQVTFASGTALTQMTVQENYSGSTYPLTPWIDNGTEGFYSASVSGLAAAAHVSWTTAAPGAWQGQGLLTLASQDLTWSRAVYALGPDHVPQPVTPAATTAISRTTTDVTFAWTISNDTDIDVQFLMFFVANSQRPQRVFAVPKTARQLTLPATLLPFQSFPLQLTWSVWAVRTSGNLQPPFFGLPTPREWSGWLGVAISPSREITLLGP